MKALTYTCWRQFALMKQWSILLALVVMATMPPGAYAQTITNLKEFTYSPDGQKPATIVQGTDGSLYGATTSGNSGSAGIVYKVDPAGLSYEILASMPAGQSCVSLAIGPDHYLYGAMPYGGLHGCGYIFRMDSTGQHFTNILSFAGGRDAANPAAIAFSSDGHLYGIGQNGGAGGVGAIFRMWTNGSSYVLIHSFDTAHGNTPHSLLIGADGKLYGTCVKGGTSGFGSIWQCSASGNEMDLYAATATDNSLSGVTQALNGLLYSAAPSGGPGSAGEVISISTTGTEKQICTFNAAQNAISSPLAVVPDVTGALYGYCQSGGAHGAGAIFSLDPQTGTLTDLYDYPLNGNSPLIGMFIGQDSRIYATQYQGNIGAGAGSQGGVFAIRTNGSGYAPIHQFVDFFDAQYPYQLAMTSTGTLIGATAGGGAYNNGVVFSVQPDGSQYAVIRDRPESAGDFFPYSGFSLNQDGNIYWWSETDGKNGDGDIEKIDLAGNDTVIYSFANSTGANPSCIVSAKDGYLYGLTWNGGSNDTGVLFRVSRDGSHFTVLHSFGSGTDGQYPAYLVQGGDGSLYGTCWDGGDSQVGTIFKYQIATGTYKQIRAMPDDNMTGGTPYSVILASDGKLYGITEWNVLFRMSTDGSNYKPLTTIPSIDGGYYTLVDGGAGVLYIGGGFLFAGDSAGIGIFMVNVAGQNAILTSLPQFAPKATSLFSYSMLALGKDGALYGVLPVDGNAPYGRIYRCSLPRTAIASVTLSPSAVTAGSTVTGTINITLAAPSGGVKVALSSDSSAAKLSSTSVTVPPGARSATFSVRTSASITSTTTATVQASLNGDSVATILTVQPAVSFSVTVNPGSVKGGASSTATISLKAPAPSGGLTFTLSSIGLTHLTVCSNLSHTLAWDIQPK
jgi:uncharacterized repeat protein (TIGR03803 family)